MSTEVGKPITVVSPVTGEVLELTAHTDALAQYLVDVRETELLLREAKKLVSREIASRLDRIATWTLRLEGGLMVKTQSPQPTEEWDALAARSELLELVDEGVLSVEAVDAAFEPVVTYKPKKAGINKLRKLGGRVAEILSAHSHEVEKERYVTVSRA